MKRILLAVLSIAAAGAPALAQADFSENFDNNGPVQSGQKGPRNLMQRGWIFRNQSVPLGAGTWFDGHTSAGWLTPQGGDGYLAVDSASTDFFGGDVSAWAILPAVPNQQAGDVLSFYLQAMDSSNIDRFEVRYSPGGGTGTGSGASGVGDFTTILAEFDPIPLTGWTVVSVEVPGTGRLALRFVVDDACNFGCFASYVGVDELTVNQSAPPGPPLPAPGETVHWTADISPVVVESDVTIVAGGTVIVDSGVTVQLGADAQLFALGSLQFEPGSQLEVAPGGDVRVQGVAHFQGSSAAPVVMTGGIGGAFADGVEVSSGAVVTLDYVESDLPVYVDATASIYNPTATAILVDHSTFTGDGEIRGVYTTVAIRNSTFAGPDIVLQDSYLLVESLVLDGSQIYSTRYDAGQPMHLDTIEAGGVTDDAPFVLSGFDHYFGSGNSIAGNLYPVSVPGGGIAPGSTLPSSGNTVNQVNTGYGEAMGRITFADAGLPYRVLGDPFSGRFLGGQLTIEPGVTVLLEPAASFFATGGARLIAEGLPDRPITFDRAIAGQDWYDIGFAVNSTRPRLEHCVIRGSELGVLTQDLPVRLDSCLIEDNRIGAIATTFGTVVARKTRFDNNDVAVQTSIGAPPGFGAGNADLDGLTNPNSFEGNGLAVEVLDPITPNRAVAPNNWWNSASGPQHPTNPAGTGELATGNAQVTPFRSTPPDFDDLPPVVRLAEPYFLLDAGQKIVLTWTAEDDHAITGQRLMFSEHSENPGLRVLVDEIPAHVRTLEIEVPAAQPSSNLLPPVFRVVAIDSAGQEGWDEALFFTPTIDFAERVTPAPIFGEYRPGDQIDVCYTFSGGIGGTVDLMLFLDGDDQAYSLGGGTTAIECLPGALTMPPVSTDLARVGARFNYGAGGRNRWEFTDYFSIRPDPLVGDVPPAVSLLSPTAGAQFSGGGVVPISWSSSDDEAVRSHDVQASYDDGRTWHTIVRELPGAQTSFDWQLPASESGIADVRVRVIARDQRFQNSSAGANVSFEITPGDGPQPGDVDGDGDVDLSDLGTLLSAYGTCAGDPGYVAAADFDAGGCIDLSDLGVLLAAYGT